MADDYPKLINVGGVSVTIHDASEDGRWALVRESKKARAGYRYEAVEPPPLPPPPVSIAVTPTDVIAIEPENEDARTDETPKHVTKKGAKKK